MGAALISPTMSIAILNHGLFSHLITSIDSSPCVSNIVVVKKKTGGCIRVCVGVVNINKAIIPSSYPLPTFDELSCKLYVLNSF